MTLVGVPARPPAPDARPRSATRSRRNLCRCTGYQNIVEAVKLASTSARATLSRHARRSGNEDARLLTGRALFVDDVQLPGMLHVAFVRSEYAHGRLTSRRRGRRAHGTPGVVAVYTAADLGDYWKPGPLLVPPPPIPGLIFNALHAGAARTRQGAPRGRADRDGRGREPLRRRGRGRDDRRRRRSARRGRRSRRRARAGAPLVHEHLASQRRRARRPARRATTTPRRRTATSRRSSGGSSTTAASRRRSRIAPSSRDWDAQRRRADDLGHHPGADSDPQRAGAHARPARVAGARDRAVRRRRLRPEDHDVLPGRSCCSRGRRCGWSGR